MLKACGALCAGSPNRDAAEGAANDLRMTFAEARQNDEAVGGATHSAFRSLHHLVRIDRAQPILDVVHALAANKIRAVNISAVEVGACQIGTGKIYF